MRSTQSRRPDHLPRIIDAESHTESFPPGKPAQVAHPVLVAPDEGMHSRRATRFADHLPLVIDGVGFTLTIAGKNAQVLNGRSILPDNSTVIAMGEACDPRDHARIVDRHRFAEIR